MIMPRALAASMMAMKIWAMTYAQGNSSGESPGGSRSNSEMHAKYLNAFSGICWALQKFYLLQCRVGRNCSWQLLMIF